MSCVELQKIIKLGGRTTLQIGNDDVSFGLFESVLLEVKKIIVIDIDSIVNDRDIASINYYLINKLCDITSKHVKKLSITDIQTIADSFNYIINAKVSARSEKMSKILSESNMLIQTTISTDGFGLDAKITDIRLFAIKNVNNKDNEKLYNLIKDKNGR